MGKKVAKKESKPSVAAAEIEESETVIQKKENAKKLARSLKSATAAVLA